MLPLHHTSVKNMSLHIATPLSGIYIAVVGVTIASLMVILSDLSKNCFKTVCKYTIFFGIRKTFFRFFWIYPVHFKKRAGIKIF